RGGLTIWKLGHCPRAWGQQGAPLDAPGTFLIGFFEFGQGQRGPMIPYCPGPPVHPWLQLSFTCVDVINDLLSGKGPHEMPLVPFS
ncbi:unnamed protein product, partial [Staurois parvus]